MAHWIYILLGIFAVWRLTYDFINLDGPFGLYGAVKKFVDGKKETWPAWVIDGMTCYHCLSFWAGFGVALLLPWGSWQQYLLHALGMSGAVTLGARYLKSMYGSDLFEE